MAAFAINAVWGIAFAEWVVIGGKDFSGLPILWAIMLCLCPFVDIVIAGMLAYFHVQAQGAKKALFCAAFLATLTPWWSWALVLEILRN
jgi:hypothetical protein